MSQGYDHLTTLTAPTHPSRWARSVCGPYRNRLRNRGSEMPIPSAFASDVRPIQQSDDFGMADYKRTPEPPPHACM
jgi:hypothetical protein